MSVISVRTRGIRPLLLLSALGTAVVLSACGGGDKKVASQVVAKVNKEEISVHQVNFLLQRQPNVAPDQLPVVSKRVLEALIDQELALQQAMDQKLDRDPSVAAAIEASKRDIIAKAYAERVSSSASKPTDEDIKKYYSENPALFSQRRIYNFNEFQVQASSDQISAVTELAKHNVNTEALTAQLKKAGYKFNVRSATQPAENLPLNLLDKLAALSEGQALASAQPGGVGIIQIVGVKLAPVDEASAKPAIEQFLLNDRKREVVNADIKRLRAAANIEYKGQFAQDAASASAGAASR